MSKIGKQILNIPIGTTVTLIDGVLSVKGPKGENIRSFRNEIEITIKDGNITLAPLKKDMFLNALWGTYASIIKSMIIGVNTPYEKKLLIEGVGFKAEVSGDNLIMALGFSHPVKVAIPKDLKVMVDKTGITITGINKEKVGEFSAS